MSAYWIAHVTVTDPERYKFYQDRAIAAFTAHGASFLARGGESEVLEGPALARHVVIQFPSLAAAKACYASDAYREARLYRDGAATVHLVIVDGTETDPVRP
ncbi:MAG: hypothetical protein B7Z02_03095 [Rhodobacterales bacterium 32-67-9]|nr:MAG: hypothetical protein B7Z02_03095 [Rhodobacterales bacterium 32-67-9]